jgi:hypothetical protein
MSLIQGDVSGRGEEEMATRLAPGMYQLTALEGLQINIVATGTLFNAVVGMDGALLPVPPGGGTIGLTPQMMNGSGSHHKVDIRTLFNGATVGANYTVTIVGAGTVLDSFVVNDPGTQIGHVQLIIVVV